MPQFLGFDSAWIAARHFIHVIMACGIGLLLSASAFGDDEIWGDLTMRFVFDGESPRPRKFIQDGGLPPILDESLLIDPKTHGIANVVLWLDTDSGRRFPRVHPDYAKQAGKKQVQTIQNRALVPRVAILRTDQPLEFRNAEQEGYNLKCAFFHNEPFNNLLRPAESFQATFPHAERAPAKVECSIHPWLTGWLIVCDHPYAAVSDRDGVLTLPKLPVGEWTFIAWHERPGFVKQVTLGEKPVEWQRGRVTLKIGPGDNDLGNVLVSPDIFKR